ncbi:hypothetical protein AAFF_G00355010 [Aldrovandia affinis]|uniref:protein-synthesizing GTPase n=1 Tax=Aldrovandia affinis TaxID=143900 RepID=A0AAD7SIQ5_9TELE|nr:hypothetical protein AAFF_G00355010 [Aldrovandia affinis]
MRMCSEPHNRFDAAYKIKLSSIVMYLMASDESGVTLGQPHLFRQELSTLDVTTLTPLSREIISRQATINIGTIGHVAHGKSTVVKAISGVHTVRFKNELERNITIKLGYANAKVYKLDDPSCPRPECYRSCGSSTPDEFPTDIPGTKGNFKLVRHVSFVDCPGHDILMATMLNGAAVMDAALLLIAGNESCPQPQTSEHLAAIEIMKLKHILILQNKIDLVKESQAKEQYEQILAFVQGTVAEGAPIIPISAQLKYNIEVVCEYIVKKIPVPIRDFTSEPRLIVIRSFDVNKPGCEVDDLKGGVAGGSILKGVLKVGQELEVRPGIVSKDHEGKLMCKPIFSKIVSLFAEHNDLQYAAPGGLIGVGTKIDPTLCRADRMVGQVLGAVGALPEIFTELEISYFLLRRLLGVRTEGDKKAAKVQKLSKNEVLMVNIGSLSTGGRVSAVKADLAKIVLTNPVCTEVGEKIALSRRVEKHWRPALTGSPDRGRHLAAGGGGGTNSPKSTKGVSKSRWASSVSEEADHCWPQGIGLTQRTGSGSTSEFGTTDKIVDSSMKPRSKHAMHPSPTCSSMYGYVEKSWDSPYSAKSLVSSSLPFTVMDGKQTQVSDGTRFKESLAHYLLPLASRWSNKKPQLPIRKDQRKWFSPPPCTNICRQTQLITLTAADAGARKFQSIMFFQKKVKSGQRHRRDNARQISEEASNKAYAFLTSDGDAEIQPGRGVKMNGLMVDTGATSHIIMDIAKFKKFDDRFQSETHCVELADGTRSNGITERRGDVEDIFSVKAATANGATIIFKEGKDVLQDRDDSRCEKGIFVGYDKNSPAYMVYYPDKGKVQKHRLVKCVTKAIVDQQTQTDMMPDDEMQNRASKTRQDTDGAAVIGDRSLPVTVLLREDGSHSHVTGVSVHDERAVHVWIHQYGGLRESRSESGKAFLARP